MQAQLSFIIKALIKVNLTFLNQIEVTPKGQKYFRLKLESYLE